MVHVPAPVRRAHASIGDHVRDQRRLLGLTTAMVAQRADISLKTLRQLEQGESVRLETFLRVLRVLGMLDAVVTATDPLSTAVGRVRAGEQLPERVRTRRDG